MEHFGVVGAPRLQEPSLKKTGQEKHLGGGIWQGQPEISFISRITSPFCGKMSPDSNFEKTSLPSALTSNTPPEPEMKSTS